MFGNITKKFLNVKIKEQKENRKVKQTPYFYLKRK